MMTGPNGRDTEGGCGGGSPDSPDRHNHQHNTVDEHNHEHQGQHVTGTASHPHRQQSHSQRRASSRRASVVSPINYNVPDDYANLEASNISPVQNPDEEPITRHQTLEQVGSQDREYLREQRQHPKPPAEAEPSEDYDREKGAQQPGAVRKQNVSRLATELYTISYLIFFSLLGTLARLGLQALTSNYPQSLVIFPSIWPNFAGCVVMGFLAEDRMLFRSDWGQEPALKKDDDVENSSGTGSVKPETVDTAAAKKAHLALKKSIPLYIGLATGFCGSFTSFSSFVRDIFLALSNDLSPFSSASIESRNGGYSFMALLSVMITTISLSLSGLFLGAHLAIALAPLFVKTGLTLPYTFVSRFLDRLVVLLGFGCWLGAVFLSIWPPDRHSTSAEKERWRGTATFALVFAPLGCLLRFYASAHLNGRLPSFPLGTFVVNMFGTAVLGMAWDLEHVPSGLGGVVGCQVLQGVADGFCGCLTTVSTWAAELAALRRRNAYVYGGASVGGGLALLVVIMGGLRWTEGFEGVKCVH
ncbi:CrcB-like protein-domain-containing protein [Sordaria brevicollis]|uniref:CrcB-like protein-domain-containing protein n=1 Tax=Sordaria brevicollis TaxID=83679 RepID=A0AAE0UEJ8_SORBR|nr:CrcB-like protein-domain-containing protein [Sordaria brevicollis]